eukprot:1762585-Amphidinium_carterae.1
MGVCLKLNCLRESWTLESDWHSYDCDLRGQKSKVAVVGSGEVAVLVGMVPVAQRVCLEVVNQ